MIRQRYRTVYLHRDRAVLYAVLLAGVAAVVLEWFR